MFFVYLLVNENKEHYIGFTSNIDKRLSEHNDPRNTTKTTQGHVWELVYYEAYINEHEARIRERSIKASGKGRSLLYERVKESEAECYARISAGEAANLSPGKRRP